MKDLTTSRNRFSYSGHASGAACAESETSQVASEPRGRTRSAKTVRICAEACSCSITRTSPSSLPFSFTTRSVDTCDARPAASAHAPARRTRSGPGRAGDGAPRTALPSTSSDSWSSCSVEICGAARRIRGAWEGPGGGARETDTFNDKQQAGRGPSGGRGRGFREAKPQRQGGTGTGCATRVMRLVMSGGLSETSVKAMICPPLSMALD